MKTLLLIIFPLIIFAQTQDSNAEAALRSGDDSQENLKDWSFGVLYVPYYSGTVYRLFESQSYPSDPTLYSLSENKTDLEAELTYGVSALRLSLSAGYSSSYEDTRHEEHNNYSGTQNESGYVSTMGLKLLDFTVGLKYYFGNILDENVIIYTEAGLGKQIAFAENNYDYIFVEPQPGVINEDNAAEFTEELNSPWHFNLGFGAEYFFNQSLSLKSNIRVLYSSVNGRYNSRYVTETSTQTVSEERTFTYFVTKIGLGLNFYF